MGRRRELVVEFLGDDVLNVFLSSGVFLAHFGFSTPKRLCGGGVFLILHLKLNYFELS